MKRILEFLRSLAFGLVCLGIACLIMIAVILNQPPSTLGALSGMDAFYYIMEGKGDLCLTAVVFIFLAISLAVLCVSSLFNAIAVLFSGKGQVR